MEWCFSSYMLINVKYTITIVIVKYTIIIKNQENFYILDLLVSDCLYPILVEGNKNFIENCM